MSVPFFLPYYLIIKHTNVLLEYIIVHFWYDYVCQTKCSFVFINKFKHFLNYLTAFRNPTDCKNDNIDIDDQQK